MHLKPGSSEYKAIELLHGLVVEGFQKIDQSIESLENVVKQTAVVGDYIRVFIYYIRLALHK